VNRYVNRMTAVEIRKRNCGSKAAVAPEPLPKTFGEGAAPGELDGEFDVPLVITVLQEKKDLHCQSQVEPHFNMSSVGVRE
jgi:hypothetical protein